MLYQFVGYEEDHKKPPGQMICKDCKGKESWSLLIRLSSQMFMRCFQVHYFLLLSHMGLKAEVSMTRGVLAWYDCYHGSSKLKLGCFDYMVPLIILAHTKSPKPCFMGGTEYILLSGWLCDGNGFTAGFIASFAASQCGEIHPVFKIA